LLGVMLASLVLFLSCAPRLHEFHIVPPSPSFHMLIAADTSPFKDRIREDLIAAYRYTGAIHVIDIRDLSRIDTAPYDVVVLLDTCLAWSGFNFSVKTFLDNPGNRARTVLAMTAGDPDWQYQYQGVDAVTAASRPAGRAQFLARIKAGIEAVLLSENAGKNRT